MLNGGFRLFQFLNISKRINYAIHFIRWFHSKNLKWYIVFFYLLINRKFVTFIHLHIHMAAGDFKESVSKECVCVFLHTLKVYSFHPLFLMRCSIHLSFFALLISHLKWEIKIFFVLNHQLKKVFLFLFLKFFFSLEYGAKNLFFHINTVVLRLCCRRAHKHEKKETNIKWQSFVSQV